MNYSEIFIPFVIFGAFVAITKIISDARTRNKLIEKGLVDEKVKYLFTKNTAMSSFSSLKWGLVLVGLGVALMASYIWPDLLEDGGTFGLMFLFAGIAFLIYFGVAQKEIKENRSKHQQVTD